MENNLVSSNNFCTFGGWIGGSCKPSEKGKLTAFPRFKICQRNLINSQLMLMFEDLPEINSERWLSLENFEGEEWKDVVGYEEILQISCYGRLKRKHHVIFNPHSGYCTYKEKILKIQSNKLGYHRINLSIGNNTKKNLSVHRLVLTAFVPNPYNLPFVNHKDENPSNNCVYNLEWCTPKYNSNYGTVNDRRKHDRIEKGTTQKVLLYDYEGNLLKRYGTAKDAGIDNGISRELVVLCCNGEVSSANGLHFRFDNDIYTKRDINTVKNNYLVYKNGELIFQTNQTKELCRYIGVGYSNFRGFIKYGRKSCRGLESYTIVITTQKGDKYSIVNGKKDFDKCV